MDLRAILEFKRNELAERVMASESSVLEVLPIFSDPNVAGAISDLVVLIASTNARLTPGREVLSILHRDFATVMEAMARGNAVVFFSRPSNDAFGVHNLDEHIAYYAAVASPQRGADDYFRLLRLG